LEYIRLGLEIWTNVQLWAVLKIFHYYWILFLYDIYFSIVNMCFDVDCGVVGALHRYFHVFTSTLCENFVSSTNLSAKV